jgi:hypothetical protein
MDTLSFRNRPKALSGRSLSLQTPLTGGFVTSKMSSVSIVMNTMSKAIFAAAIAVLSANASAGTGYYVSSGTNSVTVPGGGSGFGTSVAVLSTTVAPGSYLITARIDGFSYAPNSGASCYFMHNQTQAGTEYYTINTSSDWSHTTKASQVALNLFTTDVEAVVSLVCAHGYGFTNASIFGGEMTLTPVDSLGQ